MVKSEMDIFSQVQALLLDDDYEAAIKLLTDADLSTDNKAEAYRMLGYIYYQTKNYEKSIANSTKALDVKTLELTETSMAHYFRGRAAADFENYDLAILDTMRLLELAESESDCFEDAYEIVELIMRGNWTKTSAEGKLQLAAVLLHCQNHLLNYSEFNTEVSSWLTQVRDSHQ